MKTIIKVVCLVTINYFISCSPAKNVSKGNYFFEYVSHQRERVKGDVNDKILVYSVCKSFESKTEEKYDHLLIKNKKLALKKSSLIDSVEITPPIPSKILLGGSLYSNENIGNKLDSYQKDFVFTETKLGLQTLSIPLKFRGKIDDGSVIPNQVETGFNVGLAPMVKFNFNHYNPGKKRMGKNNFQYSISSGLLLNLGSADLKNASSAPGISVDRKAATFTYGTFVMLGVGNFNIGYAIGFDNAIGDGSSNWVYQNKLWHGLVIGLDIIKQ